MDQSESGQPPPRQIQVDEVLRRLRARVQAELAGPGAALAPPADRASVPSRWQFDGLPRLERPLDLTAATPSTLSDYTDQHDEDFVRYAYHGLLGRAPDASGWAAHLTSLRTGARTKVQILGRIRYSAEGRRHRAPIAGLLPRFLLDQLCRVPVLGYALRVGIGVARLPRLQTEPARLEAYVNHRLLDSTRRLDEGFARVEAAMRGLERVSMPRAESIEGLEALGERLRELAHEKASHAEISALQTRQVELAAGQEALVARKANAEEVNAHLHTLVEQLAALDTQQSALRLEQSSLAATTERKADASRVDALAESIAAEVSALAPAERLDMLAKRLEAISLSRAQEAQVRADRRLLVDARFDALGGRIVEVADRELTAVRSALAASDAHLERVDEQLQAQRLGLLDEQRRVALLLEEARRRLPKPIAEQETEVMVSEQEHLLDSMYSSLEDRFRGTRPEVMKRLSTYVPRIADAARRTAGAPVLDLGCGRGEWLELMRDASFDAVGVDANRTMVQRCIEASLSAVECGAIEFLREQPAGSFGAITAFHLLEHLPFRDLVTTLDESVRALRPGGVAIFETPNPENLAVGATGFYADPTHRNPLFPPTLQFLLEQRGFVDVEIVRPYPRELPAWLQPLPASDPQAERLNPLLQLVATLFYVSPDFAVVGRKA